ncbi:MAG: hypothetical protein K0S55_1571 [Clostridia bacterium]|jgi:hypothetical protein|nr:hypothetical protein [Clostridia bacterium]
MSDETKSTKKPVGVYIYISPEGSVRPLKIKWYDDHFTVEKYITSSQRPASKLGASVCGIAARLTVGTHTYSRRMGGRGLLTLTVLNSLPRYYATVIDSFIS